MQQRTPGYCTHSQTQALRITWLYKRINLLLDCAIGLVVSFSVTTHLFGVCACVCVHTCVFVQYVGHIAVWKWKLLSGLLKPLMDSNRAARCSPKGGLCAFLWVTWVCWRACSKIVHCPYGSFWDLGFGCILQACEGLAVAFTLLLLCLHSGLILWMHKNISIRNLVYGLSKCAIKTVCRR